MELSGVEFAIPKGIKLSFPDQAWYGHTEGKLIAELIENGKLGPGKFLPLQGQLPPCSNCKAILKWASDTFQMAIEYVDSEGTTWTWVNGTLK